MKTSGSHEIKIFFLALNTGYVEGSLPDQRCVEFYRARSGGGLHCAIVGNVVLPGGSPSNSTTSEMSRDAVWRELATAIRDAGAKPGIQLATAWPQYKGITKFLPEKHEDPVQDYRHVIGHLTKRDVASVFDSLLLGTELAIDAGFEHIQLHAAHGYLFNLLLDERFHTGAKSAWAKVNEWVKGIAERGLESSIRISMFSGDKKLDGTPDATYLQGAIAAEPDYLDISNGFYNISKQLIYPARSQIEARSALTLKFAANYPRQLFIASGMSFALQLPGSFANVHAGICRDLIANPNFLSERDRGCALCMRCHYYTFGRSEVSCGQWPDYAP